MISSPPSGSTASSAMRMNTAYTPWLAMADVMSCVISTANCAGTARVYRRPGDDTFLYAKRRTGKCRPPADDSGDAGHDAVLCMRVLVVEDEVNLASVIRKFLREEGLLADVAIKGEDALWMAAASPYDAIVLDIKLPGIDGFATCRRLRRARIQTPILMLTALDAVDDRIAGLDSGADDYLVKPFDLGELLAR